MILASGLDGGAGDRPFSLRDVACYKQHDEGERNAHVKGQYPIMPGQTMLRTTLIGSRRGARAKKAMQSHLTSF